MEKASSVGQRRRETCSPYSLGETGATDETATERVAFADESGTHGSTRCYGIGAVSLDAKCLSAFNERFLALKEKHRLGSEMHWQELHNRFSDINAILEWVDLILRSSTAAFDVIVVNTALYHNWSSPTMTHEDAFYRTYGQLLTKVAQRGQGRTKVCIDERSDSYPRNAEVLEVVGNRRLARMARAGRLRDVEMVSSLSMPGVQVADVLVGLVVAAHTRRLDSNVSLNFAKDLAIARAAGMLGWDHLFYDTMPGSKLNIWHFPREWRADPKTREINYSRRIPFVTKDDMKQSREQHKCGTPAGTQGAPLIAE